jgi:hypothetical protein
MENFVAPLRRQTITEIHLGDPVGEGLSGRAMSSARPVRSAQ